MGCRHGSGAASPSGKFKYGVQALSWSPDGQRLAGGGGPLSGFNNDLPGELRIWDGATGKELRNLAGHKGYINSVAWSHDGGRLAAASGEFGAPGNVKIWDTTTALSCSIWLDTLIRSTESHGVPTTNTWLRHAPMAPSKSGIH